MDGGGEDIAVIASNKTGAGGGPGLNVRVRLYHRVPQ